MITALIAGSCVALFGVLLSLIVNNWFIALVFSGTVGVISMVLTSILRNASIVMMKKSKESDNGRKSLEEADKIAKMVGIFGLPNIVLAVVTYIIMYGIQSIIDFFR